MQSEKLKTLKRKKRHGRIRVNVVGTSQQPRLSIYRSHQNLYAQVIDDIEGKTIFSFSTQHKEIKGKMPFGGNIKAAQLLGETFARKASELGLKRLVFDKGPYLYHGRIKAFADSARKGGLEF